MMMVTDLISALVLVLSARCASGSYPRAQNVTWKSTNFKTILSWEPKPSPDFSYTVEFSAVGGNKQSSLHCLRSSATVCDLSGSLTELDAYYTAEVLSEPPLGATSDLVEFPYTSAPRFCPYKDTEIGRPNFKLEVSDDKKKTTLYVADPATALYKDGRQLNIRDVFSDQLQYRVTYRKNKSTGKKVYNYKTNIIELLDLDRGVSYCFNVQAYLPDRAADKQLGELSHTQCTKDHNQSIFEVYSVGVIASAIFLILLLIGIIIAVTYICCKRHKNSQGREKEGMPLRDV
ncbi:coagulation factor IIIa [Scophthalmus maximus]|nr:coagulation factor IIIa [Scophthalmus maximus]